MAGLDRIVQADFSAGMWTAGARDRIPSNAAYAIQNGLIDENGSIYQRHGSSRLHATTPTGNPPVMLFSGRLRAGDRTVLVTTAELLRYSAGSLTALGGYALMPSPGRGAVIDGVLYLPGGWTYDGTTFTGAIKVSDLYTVASNRLLAATGNRVDFSVLAHTGTGSTTSGSANIASVVATSGGFQIGQQIVGTGIPVGATITAVGVGTLTISANATATGTAVPLTATGGDPRFDATDFHKLPDGAKILGMEGFRDGAAVFTTQGVWVISGLASNLTDADGNIQHRLDLYSRDLILWGNAGVAAWSGGLVVPGRDGVWLMSLGVSSEAATPFRMISGPIANTYRGYVKAGYTPGQAVVYRGHYLLPIMNGSTVVSVLVCKLDGTDARGRPTYAWSQWSGYAGSSAVFSGSTDGKLLGAVREATGPSTFVVDMQAFDDSGSTSDADGTEPTVAMITRDYATGPMNANTVVKMRLGYDLTDDVGGPSIVAIVQTRDDPTYVTLTGAAPPSAGDDPYTWAVRKRAHYVRFTLTGPYDTLAATVPVASFVIRSVELFVRSSARQ